MIRPDHLRCPLDNKEFSVTSADDLPKNFALLNLLQSSIITSVVSQSTGNDAQQHMPPPSQQQQQQTHGGALDAPPSYDDVIKTNFHKNVATASSNQPRYGNY